MLRFFTGITCAILFVLSILASQSYMQNETNVQKNKALKESAEFKADATEKASIDGQIAARTSSTTSVVADIQKQIKAMSQERDSMPNDFYTKKADINKEIAKLRETLTTEQNKSLSEVSSLMTKKEQKLDTSKINILSIKGYTSTLETIASWMSTEDNIVTVQILEYWLYTIIGFIFECCAILLFFFSRREGLIYKGLKPMSAIAFLISALFTITLLADNSITIYGKIISTFMSVILEFSKCFFFYVTVNPDDKTVQHIKQTTVDTLNMVKENMSPNKDVELAKKIPKSSRVLSSTVGVEKPTYTGNTQALNTPHTQPMDEFHTAITQALNTQKYKCIDKEIVKKFLSEAENTKDEENKIAGIRTIASTIKVKENMTRSVHGLLRNLGVIEVTGKDSFLHMAKEKYLKLLALE
jgi:hypothetical protein